ncbi:hypothetical protein [Paracoccus endophyticus]|uniref:hypothetical protein n=1 Tax=Paracoccus endophyticus TaxID=2233774 RepID=UPI000DD964CB|nr:hypothetical protein [Paracoccus endophyticus]
MEFFRRRRIGTPWGSPQLSDEGREKVKQFVEGWSEGPVRREALLRHLNAELREQERLRLAERQHLASSGGEPPER